MQPIHQPTANLNCVHTMPAHFEKGKNVAAANFELAFTRYWNNLKTVGIYTAKTRCNTLMPKKLTYTLRVDKSRSKSV